MLKISKGKVKRPLRLVVDGVEGVGKSTFAAQFPDPLFIDLENGTDSMDVKRTQKPESWTELLQIVKDVAENPSVCKTLILDTGDWAEGLCVKYICLKYKTHGLESFGYGKGYVYLREEFENLLNGLDKVIAAGVNVVICAHAQIKKFELPDEAGSFDRYELKMSKNVSPLVREWCDIQLFANFKTYVVATENKNRSKGTGGTRRVMYSYQRVLMHFPDAKVLGVTATPDRGDKKNLGEYFDSMAYEYPMAQAIKDGYLVPIRAQMIPLELDLGSVKVSNGDYNAGDIGCALESYLEQIADEMVRYCEGKKTVVFLPLI